MARLVTSFFHWLYAQVSFDWVIAPFVCRAIAPAKKSFDALAFRLLEGLGVREVAVARTTLEAKDSPEDLEVRPFELVIMNRVEAPRHTPVQQGFNHLGLQQADLEVELGGRRFVWLWTEPHVACPHEPNPSIDLNHEINVCVDDVADVWKLHCRFIIPLLCCFDDAQWSPDARSRVCSSVVSVLLSET